MREPARGMSNDEILENLLYEMNHQVEEMDSDLPLPKSSKVESASTEYEERGWPAPRGDVYSQ